MTIQSYSNQIKMVVDQYAATTFVLETVVNFEIRSGEQGYLTGKLAFIDGSTLHFSEYLDQSGDRVEKLMYTYHYQDEQHQLIFRYDNARHRPPLRAASLEHKHISNQVVQAPAPTLEEVLAEIVTSKGWI